MRTVIGYMDKTDWEYEIGDVVVKVYSNIRELEEGSPCVRNRGCGIVKVKVDLVRVVRKGKADKRGKKCQTK